MTIYLADISEFQTNIDAPTYLKNYPAGLLICRVHNGNRRDNMMLERRDYLRKHDFRGIGWYQYLVSDRDPKAQANDFIDTVGKLGDNEWAVLDLEAGSGNQQPRADAWFDVVDHWAGFKAMLYSGAYFLRDHLSGADHWNRPLWVASYGAKPNCDYDLWQYGDAITFHGVTPSKCDGNQSHLTANAFMELVRGGKVSSSGGGGSAPPPSSTTTKAPKFPYPSDEWIGQPSNDPKNHSGCYGGADTTNVKTWQKQMAARGWSLGVDGCYGPESENVCRQFQAEKGLAVDGDVGPKTWEKTWSAPVTDDGGGGGGSSSSGGQTGGGGDPTKPDTSDKGWRAKAGDWQDAHLGITESPADSNCDSRPDGIRNAQDDCAGGTWLRNQPWCGVWVFEALYRANLVKADGNYSWMASVASIEDKAKAKAKPFRGWTTDGTKSKKGDLVILFGRGQHVGMVRGTPDGDTLKTWEGNTSSGSSGSQSNGGGSYERNRSRSSETYGYALVADP